jgi:hypothetical protein
MSTENIEFIDKLKEHQHIALFSDDEVKSYKIQTKFLKNGLDRGEICAYLSYKDPIEIIQMLKNNGLEPDSYLKTKKLHILKINPPSTDEEYAEFFQKNVKSLFSDTINPTVIIGEPLSQLDKKENMEIKIKLEQELHEFANNKLSILCPYNNSEIESTEHTKWLNQLFKSHNGAIFSPKETEGLSFYF